MNSDEKALLDSIMPLITNKEFDKAESQINSIISSTTYSEEAVSYAHFLMGYINTCWNNKHKNQSLAKRMLLNCIESKFPIPKAYSLFADQEEDENIAINYLKIGLSKFPESPSIYLGLLKHSKNDEAISYVNEINAKNIVDTDLLNKVVEILISMTDWEKSEMFLDKLLHQVNIPDYDRMYYTMLHSFSLIMQKKDIERAKDQFFTISEKDYSNSLKYAPYMGYIWCCAQMNLYSEFIKFFDKIPFLNGLEDLYDGPWYVINIDFKDIYKRLFEEIAIYEKDDKPRLLRLHALESYYLYLPSETYDIYRYQKKHLAALKRYYKLDVKNLEVVCAIFNMQKQYHLYFDAYKTYISMLCECLKPEKKYIDGIDFINECSIADVERIYQDLLTILKSSLDFDYTAFVSGVFDYVVGYIFNSNSKEKYIKICNLTDLINDSYLEKSKRLFEIAYAYAEVDSLCKKAEQFYLLLLKAGQDNFAVLNNLGVIYEHRNELQKAKEYYAKAYELDKSSEKYRNNLQRVSLAIQESEKGLIAIQKENSWFLGRLFNVYKLANQSDEVICTYKDRSLVLSVSPQKADEIFDKMLKCGYLTKIKQDNSQTPSKYIINPLVNKYLEKEHERIEENRIYELLAQRLNVDEIKKIGYTNELRNMLCGIGNADLRDILLRDVKECAVSLLTNQYKSCIVICGSVIEAILVDKITSGGLIKYDIGTLLNKKPRSKNVKEMDLNELLELAKAENFIDVEVYYLSSYVRSYRNIIHPSCEIRKSYDVNEDTAKLMWNVLLAIIKELLK